MSKDMLSIAMRKLFALPEEHLGTACDFLDKLPIPEWSVASRRYLRKEEVWPVPDFDRDMTKEGYTLVRDTREPWPVSLDRLSPVPLSEGDEYSHGSEIINRAWTLRADLGQRHAEYLLRNEIPSELFGKIFHKTVLFPGTIWFRSPHGFCMPGMRLSSPGNSLIFFWVDDEYAPAIYGLLCQKQPLLVP